MSAFCSTIPCNEGWDTIIGRLRLTQSVDQSLLSPVMRDLGHGDNLLVNRRQTRDEELKDVRQLFNHLQHRSIESLGQGRGSGVGAGRNHPTRKYSASPTPVLLPIFCPRRAVFAVPTLEYEWWVTVASTAATVCCSCRHHECRRRCLRRHAAPDSRSAMSLARVRLEKSRTNGRATLGETPVVVLF